MISGQLRNHKKGSNFIDKFFRKNFDIEIFISTWDKFGISVRSEERSANHRMALKNEQNQVTEEYLKDIYKTNNILIESQDDLISDEFKNVKCPEELRLREPIAYKGSIPMFYQMHKCFEMQKNFQTKNIYLRMRPDIYLIDQPEKLLHFFEKFNENTLYYSSYKITKYHQVSDKFAFGDYETLKYYSSVWEKLNDYWKNIDYSNFWDIPVGERLVNIHMRKSNFKLEDIEVKLEVDY